MVLPMSLGAYPEKNLLSILVIPGASGGIITVNNEDGHAGSVTTVFINTANCIANNCSVTRIYGINADYNRVFTGIINEGMTAAGAVLVQPCYSSLVARV